MWNLRVYRCLRRHRWDERLHHLRSATDREGLGAEGLANPLAARGWRRTGWKNLGLARFDFGAGHEVDSSRPRREQIEARQHLSGERGQESPVPTEQADQKGGD